MSGDRKFKHLSIEGWRQFGTVDINLHPTLTVLTGANGAGKSTLLNIFSNHFGWERPYLATPYTEHDGVIKYLTGLMAYFRLPQQEKAPDETVIGSVKYSTGEESALSVPTSTTLEYSLHMTNKRAVDGVYIPSHRPVGAFKEIKDIPARPLPPADALNKYVSEQKRRFRGQILEHSSIYRLKEALIAMAMFGEGNRYVRKNEELLRTYLGFVEILKKVLPPEFGFTGIEIRMPEVILLTKSGDWPLDGASGGIMSIIDMAWLIYLYHGTKQSFVVTMDEPENHLHPSMQRSLLANFIEAFPTVQFIVATHSPFIVSSVQNSNVYVLKFESDPVLAKLGKPVMERQVPRRVRSIFLEDNSKAGTANNILTEVLGVEATIPRWVERRLESIVANYRARGVDGKALADLRKELRDLGFEQFYPDALEGILRDP